MLAQGITPDEEVWVHRLRIQSRASLDALNGAWREMSASQRTERGYRSLTAYIVGLARHGLSVNLIYLPDLSCRLGDVDRAWGLMAELIEQFPLQRDGKDASELHKHHSFGAIPLNLVSHSREICVLAWQALLKSCIVHSRSSLFPALLDTMKRSGFKCNVHTYRQILSNMRSAGQSSHELRVNLHLKRPRRFSSQL